ncbi:hypothetical protein [Aphanothece sacrum]|uniref:ATPase n=1 Tax=Aphanothece sacrum FPU1 TaxID=1920663 RepID=A0A401IHI6_APHSA|nr:hypothetical protein [Aphanothece sacrum]GBF80752.1 ATPase [Aphanothece sacrum FPU1]GBF83247.1 ATPase [Aphanothece sacrum FPU3]
MIIITILPMTMMLLPENAIADFVVWVEDGLQINRGNICNRLTENESKISNIEQKAKLEIATKLIKEGLSIEQIARVLNLPLKLVKEQVEKDE